MKIGLFNNEHRDHSLISALEGNVDDLQNKCRNLNLRKMLIKVSQRKINMKYITVLILLFFGCNQISLSNQIKDELKKNCLNEIVTTNLFDSINYIPKFKNQNTVLYYASINLANCSGWYFLFDSVNNKITKFINYRFLVKYNSTDTFTNQEEAVYILNKLNLKDSNSLIIPILLNTNNNNRLKIFSSLYSFESEIKKSSIYEKINNDTIQLDKFEFKKRIYFILENVGGYEVSAIINNGQFKSIIVKQIYISKKFNKKVSYTI